MGKYLLPKILVLFSIVFLLSPGVVFAGVPRCTVSGPTSVVVNTNNTYSMTGASTGGVIGQVELAKSPTSSQSWTSLSKVGGATTSSATAFATPGTYYVVCNAWETAASGGVACTGNPWGAPAPWIGCGAASRATVTAKFPAPTFKRVGTCTYDANVRQYFIGTNEVNDVPGAWGYRFILSPGGYVTDGSGIISYGSPVGANWAGNNTLQVAAETGAGQNIGNFASRTIVCPPIPNPTQPPMPPPSNLAATCASPGTSATLTWNDNWPTANRWDIRVTDTTTGTTTILPTLPEIPRSRTITSVPGHSYSWTMRTQDVSGIPQSTLVNGPAFTCASAASTITPTPFVVVNIRNQQGGAVVNTEPLVSVECTFDTNSPRTLLSGSSSYTFPLRQTTRNRNCVYGGGTFFNKYVLMSVTGSPSPVQASAAYRGGVWGWPTWTWEGGASGGRTMTWVVATVTPTPGSTSTPTAGGPTSTRTPTPTRTGTPTRTPTPTVCVPDADLNLSPSSTSKSSGQTTQFEAQITNLVTCGNTVRVDFSSSNTSLATVSPTTDSSAPYRTTATATSSTSASGRADIEARIYIGGVLKDTDTSRFDVVSGAAPSCSFDLSPSTSNASVSQTQSYTVSNATVQNGSISRVDFSVDNPGVATINPTTDSSATYRTTATGVSSGTATITADMFVGASTDPVCSDSSTVVVGSLSPWWQVKASSPITNGNLSSLIPSTCTGSCTDALITYDSDESPGVAVAQGTINVGSGQISQGGTPWSATSGYNGPSYSYDYFESRARCGTFEELTSSTIDSSSDLRRGTPVNGYYWNRYSGTNLTIEDNISVGSNKIILFVDGDVTIEGDISLNDGRGFFLLVASGNITVDPSVEDLEGVYFTNKQFITGTDGPNSDNQLYVRGSVVAFDKVVLQRNLPDNSSTPSELFEYAPEMLLQFPDCLNERSVEWKEQAP